MNLKAQLQNILQSVCEGISPQAKIFVALSGGVDSSVLCYLLAELFPERVAEKSLIALHVNHGLQRDAEKFEKIAKQLTQAYGMVCHVFCLRLQVPQGESPEDYARRARYDCLFSQRAPEDVLMLGHHLEDQAETFLLQALRGSGVAGLSAMQEVDHQKRLYRPFLTVSKKDLKKLAKQEGLVWIEDPTNQDNTYDRNFLRNEIFPRLVERFPASHRTLARAAENCSESLRLREFCWQTARVQGLVDQEDRLDLTKLLALDVQVARQWMKAWFDQKRILISRAQLEEIWNHVIMSAIDATPIVEVSGYVIRRFRKKLYCMVKRGEVQSYSLLWTGDEALSIPHWKDTLTREILQSQGLDIKALDWNIIRVHNHREGLRAHPKGRKRSQTLKKLFQEYQVPPWQREIWPIISMGEEVVCVMDLFVCQKFSMGYTHSII